jgi:hypothetical protein
VLVEGGGGGDGCVHGYNGTSVSQTLRNAVNWVVRVEHE